MLFSEYCVLKSSDVYFDAKIGELYPAQHCLSWTLYTGPPELLSAGVSRLPPPRQLTRSLGRGSAAAVAAWSRLAARRRCGGVLIGSSSQAAEAAPPRQSVHWAAAGLTPQPETGDMRCHYPFIETTPTHHTFDGPSSLPFLLINN